MRAVLHLDWNDKVRSAGPILRRIEGYEAIKRRIAKGSEEDLHLHAFSYAFLQGAKNVDFYLEADDSAIRERIDDLAQVMIALEDLERDGRDLKGEDGVSKDIYLALRRVVGRASARDERRALVHFLMNGPASPEELTEALGLRSNLADRLIKALDAALEGPDADGRYGISDGALAIVLFLVRETTGISPLDHLSHERLRA
jgi:hypothetical protein